MNTITTQEPPRRRSDYTHRFNATAGRHGWLRLTPAYSVRVVDDLLQKYSQCRRILDPFSGTSTTVLSAAYHGIEGVTLDINPFLVWLGRVKTAHYTDEVIEKTRSACIRIVIAVRKGTVLPVKAPKIHNVGRWWEVETLAFLCALKAAIDYETVAQSSEQNLMLVAFCRTLIQLSRVSFGHQSMSFKNGGQLNTLSESDMIQRWCKNLKFVLSGASDNPTGSGKVVLGDARRLGDVVHRPFDLVITSPPYANRMSYIRELRPYMYWLGFLDSKRDAGDLDWSAIGGTWGVATSRLRTWKLSRNSFEHPMIDRALRRIAHHENKNGTVLANYVAKYFDDIWKHLNSLVSVLGENADVNYIVGNSTFYGVLLPVEQIYASMLVKLGFRNVQCHPIRKRNSKKELFEFNVVAHWAR